MCAVDRIMTLDVGNSRIKASLFGEGRMIHSLSCTHDEAIRLPELCKDLAPEGIVYCAVGRRISDDLIASLAGICPGLLLEMDHSTKVPIGINYATPDTLGLDRVAAAVGASALFPGCPAMVVDAGTAVTIDVLDGENVFRGGNISPGIYLRLKALHGFTAALPMVVPEGPLPPFGYDTASAIRSGVVRGLAYEIAASFAMAKDIYGVGRILLSGGDAPLLLPLLDSITDGCVLSPDLVAYGLLAIYNYNAS